ncbi:MAG TPA: transcription antitermination factor NusB [Spirochaetota bacterium]|nr:transcription antitermination factor NusB [Spirochaetota bacterium]
MSDKTGKYSIKSRREGRVLAFQSLFSYGFDCKDPESLLKFDWTEEDYSNESLEYAKLLVNGTLSNIDEIDKIIKSKLKNWDYERISNVDKRF